MTPLNQARTCGADSPQPPRRSNSRHRALKGLWGLAVLVLAPGFRRFRARTVLPALGRPAAAGSPLLPGLLAGWLLIAAAIVPSPLPAGPQPAPRGDWATWLALPPAQAAAPPPRPSPASPSAQALTRGETPPQPITEQLRLQVPEEQRQIWLEAERATWEPWLASQNGFLGRELLWDPVHGEATLLIRWASRAQWKAIPQDAIDAVQARFEAVVRERLGDQTPMPFPLLYEGELISPDA